MNEFKVSVIIPAYNEAPRIGRSIQSVLNQTYPVNEIIIVDDGSTDNTQEVVAHFGNRVKYIKQTNQGVSAARNLGISHAKSVWIAFLDADDEWFPTHIHNAMLTLTDYPQVVWYCAAFERRREDGISEYIHRVNDSFRSDSIINDYFVTEAKTSFSRPSSMLVKKDIFITTGLFNLGIGHGEDLDMWFRIALRHPQIAYNPHPGCIYWQRQGSITSFQMNDIPRFLRRIKITEESGLAYNHQRSNPGADLLLSQWVRYAIKGAIKQKDFRSLRIINNTFSQYLSKTWKIIIRILSYRITIELAYLIISLRSNKLS